MSLITVIFFMIYISKYVIYLLDSASELNRVLVTVYPTAMCARRLIPVVRGRKRLAMSTRLMPCRELGSVMDVCEKIVGSRNEMSEGLSLGLVYGI
jgi:hypothetical protein